MEELYYHLHPVWKIIIIMIIKTSWFHYAGEKRKWRAPFKPSLSACGCFFNPVFEMTDWAACLAAWLCWLSWLFCSSMRHFPFSLGIVRFLWIEELLLFCFHWGLRLGSRIVKANNLLESCWCIVCLAINLVSLQCVTTVSSVPQMWQGFLCFPTQLVLWWTS